MAFIKKLMLLALQSIAITKSIDRDYLLLPGVSSIAIDFSPAQISAVDSLVLLAFKPDLPLDCLQISCLAHVELFQVGKEKKLLVSAAVSLDYSATKPFFYLDNFCGVQLSPEKGYRLVFVKPAELPVFFGQPKAPIDGDYRVFRPMLNTSRSIETEWIGKVFAFEMELRQLEMVAAPFLPEKVVERAEKEQLLDKTGRFAMLELSLTRNNASESRCCSFSTRFAGFAMVAFVLLFLRW
ncbi:hypothetical protein MHBO_003269 [Bonamia ostreae]|uniref:Uncharacterized protein n=1 Tax=Bonamia ostreae TaxID=126728 RepID=A0ABV2AQ02_9EUKA